jgi:large subunit ribosomal protein L9
MEIILMERIERLGQMGDVVSVKDGYARNFLLPQGKALRANKANRARFEERRVQLEADNLENQKEAQSAAEKIDGNQYIIIRQAGESGQLYGSVSTRDVATLMTDGGASVTRNQVILDRPIKLLGLHDVRIVLHPEVSLGVVVNVARTEEEAERQARGEDMTVDQFDEDQDALAAEEIFEDEELAKEAAEELAADEAADDQADNSAGDTASEDTASEDTASEDTASEDTASEDTASEDGEEPKDVSQD